MTVYTEKTCRKCQTVKPPAEFYRDRRGVLSALCRACRRELERERRKDPEYRKRKDEKSRQWMKENRERYNERARRWRKNNPDWLRHRHLHREYAMTPKEYQDLLGSQDNRCAICQTPVEDQPENVLQVDHDHATGQVRGLLCSACNRGLGAFRDDPTRLERAIHYLRSR